MTHSTKPASGLSGGKDWWKTSVVYQIYPRSFADSNADGIGDLRGIIDRLGYLSDLGIDTMWLSPVFTSPMVDFGYDISNHCDIDMIFGTLADADELIGVAHRRGIRVILDIVLGHTSDQHPWFKASASSLDSPLRNFYVWADGPTPGSPAGGPPNNWTAGFPDGAAAWTWDAGSFQWYLHSHLPQQPDLNWDNPEVASAQLDVLRFWLDHGVDGVRLDSINRLGKDPQLRDNVEGLPLRQQNWPTVHDHLSAVRRVIDEYEHRVAVGEVWIFDQRELVPYLAENELHLVHNFVFARLPFDASSFRDVIQEFTTLAGDSIWPAWFLNNHDEPRVASRYDYLPATGETDGRGLQRSRLMGFLVLTLRGTPFLYQGEELGLPDSPIPVEYATDRNGRDPQRTPLPWRSPKEVGSGAGFSTGEPWLPLGPSAETLNIHDEWAADGSILNLYRRLLLLRRSSPPLTLGDQRILETSNADVLGFARTHGSDVAVILLNFSIEPAIVEVTPSLVGGWKLLLSTDSQRPPSNFPTGMVKLGPLEGVVLAQRCER